MHSDFLFLALLLLLLRNAAGFHFEKNWTSNPALQSQSTHNLTLIRSVTRLLNTILLKQDKNIRPMNQKKNEPLLVEVDINVRSMGPISEQNMEFSLDCYFRQKWLDDRLAFVPPDDRNEIPLSSQMLKDIWIPDTYIRNGRRSYLHTLTVPNILFRVKSTGFITVSQRLTIRTRCQMFLSKFPMDSQACAIEVGSFAYFTSDVIYRWKIVDLDDKMGNMLSQYQFLGIAKTQLNITDYRDPNKQSSVLKVYFKLQRQQGFYILQIYTPCTLLVVMSWVSFWINKEASPARVALGIMTVLSMSTLGFGLRTDLPKVSHSTALDIYIIVCFGFVFAAMVEYAVINYAHVYYIRKKVKELQGLESNRAIEKMRMFTAGIMGARKETVQMDELSEAEPAPPQERGPWYRCFRRKQETQSDPLSGQTSRKSSRGNRGSSSTLSVSGTNCPCLGNLYILLAERHYPRNLFFVDDFSRFFSTRNLEKSVSPVEGFAFRKQNKVTWPKTCFSFLSNGGEGCEGKKKTSDEGSGSGG